MAHLETFYFLDEINLSASVGKNAVNHKDDVLVVQALLKYALEPLHYFRNDKFSEPTGTMDRNTMRLIEKFQVFARRKLKKSVSVDGRLDRAVGTKSFGRDGRWSIQLLNGEALTAYLIFYKGEENYIEDICRRFPQVKTAIGEIPVGTLNLSLESSRVGVGTLNLGLE
ncbi:MAG: hypothetical protein R2747_16090 [Pyrinomonadaceae bacterium]